MPWRFGTADYRAALKHAAVTKPLPTGGGSASWDPELAPTMRRAGRAVAEEQLLDVLLPDLTSPPNDAIAEPRPLR